MSSKELKADSLEASSTKSKKKDKSKKESKKEKKEKKEKSQKSQKRDSQDLDKDTTNNAGEDENQIEEHEDETSPKSKRFGLFRISGRKSKSSKHASKDSLKRQSRDSLDFETGGSELSLGDKSAGSMEASKPIGVLADVNKNEKIVVVRDAMTSNEAEEESTALQSTLSEPKSGDDVKPEMTEEESFVISATKPDENSEDTHSTTEPESEKGIEKPTEVNTSSSVVVPSVDEVTLEDSKQAHEQSSSRSEGESVDAVVSTGISSTGDVKETTDDDSTPDESEIEKIIISTSIQKKVSEEDDRQDGGGVTPLDEAAIVLVYPDKEQIQGEAKQQENPLEDTVVALTTHDDDNDKLVQAQVDELHKLVTSMEESWIQPKSHEEMDKEEGEAMRERSDEEGTMKKSSTKERVILDQNPEHFTPELSPFSNKKTGFTSSVPKRTSLDVISTRGLTQRDFVSSIFQPTTIASSAQEFELRFHTVSGIKEVKKSSAVMLARLKQINKKLQALRRDLAKLQESGNDETEEAKTQEMSVQS